MLLQINDETLKYEGTQAIHIERLTINKGEKIGLIGSSGSGKSTLLKFLFQASKPDAAFIHQDFALVPQLNVYHNIFAGKLDDFSTWFALKNLIKPDPQTWSEISHLLKDLGMEEKIKEKVLNLSGGQKQRTAIARALYQKKEVLIADEAISFIDPHQSEYILQLLVRSSQTLIMSLHSYELAKKYTDRLIGIQNGNIIFDLESSKLDAQKVKYLYRK